MVRSLPRTPFLLAVCVVELLEIAFAPVVAPLHAQTGGDTCPTATAVGEGAFPFDNSSDVVSGPASCDPDLSTDLWFLYTPTITGTVSIATCDSVGLLDDTTLVVYDGSGACPTAGTAALACDDDGCGTFGFHSEVVLPITAGMPLLVQVGGWNGTVGDGTLTIELVEGECADGLDDDLDGLVDCQDPDCLASPLCPAPNDTCAGALPVGEGLIAFDDSSTPVTGPTDCDPDLTGDLWYLYTPTASGVVSIATCASAGTLGNTVLIVYDATLGCPGPGAAALACDDDGCGTHAELAVGVVAGESLYLQVGGRNGQTGDGALVIAFLEGDCADGIDGDGDGLVDCLDPECDTDAACAELDCADGIDGDNDGLVDCADTDCAGFDGCEEFANCSDGIDNDLDGLVDCADPECASSPACVPLAVNDECAGAIAVAEGDFPFSNRNAPIPGPVLCDPALTGDVWYLYTATVDGWVSIRTCDGPGTLDDTVLVLYDAAAGCPDASSLPLVCDDDSCGAVPFRSRIDRFVLSGDTYFVQVGGWNGAVGTGTLTITPIETACFDGIDQDADGLIDCDDEDCVFDCDESLNCADGIDNDGDGGTDCADLDCDLAPPCLPLAPNDICATATPVGEGAFPFSNGNAPLTGPTDCLPAMTGDLWYLYTATADQVVRIDTCGGGTLLDTTLAIHDAALGCPIAPAPALACADGGCGAGTALASLDWPVVAGESLYIQVGGRNGGTGTGELSITPVVPPATALGCTDDGSAAIDCVWIPGSGNPTVFAQQVFRDGVLVATLGPTVGSTSVPYPTGFTGSTTICIESVAAVGNSEGTCCTLSVGAPGNESCAGALSVPLGDTPFDTTLTAFAAVPAVCDPALTHDLWFTHVAAVDGTLAVGTCVGGLAPFDTLLAVYDGATGCPATSDPGLACDDDGCGPFGLDAEVEVPVSTGDTLLIQVGGWNGTTGTGTLSIAPVCGGVGAVSCSYDRLADTLVVDWSANPNATAGTTVLENGVVVGTAPAGTSSFALVGPSPGTNLYELTWTCALTGQPGTPGSCTTVVVPPVPADATAVVIANERVGHPFPGAIDSGAALADALTAQGEEVFIFAAPDFDTLGLDLSGIDALWVCLGTFPEDYRLSAEEGDFLADLNANGLPVYIESADHWGFAHVPSGFDARDGHQDSIEIDGDDTFVTMVAATGNTVADLTGSFPGIVPYTPDQPFENTDRLVIDPLEGTIATAEVLWRQGGQGYITAIHATHGVGAPSIVQTWEFGGFPAIGRETLAARYREFLGLADPTPVPTFERGNCNADGSFNIADAIFLLGALFPGPSGGNVIPCPEACDGNDDDNLNIADAVFLLTVLFPGPGGGGTMPPPVACGADPTTILPQPLECGAFPPCSP